MLDDATLLRRYAAEKSEEAFAELVRRHVDLVYSTALRQLAGDSHLAHDVTQVVFTALARKASSLIGHASLTGWLYLGAHHAAAQSVRGEQRRRTREQEASTMQELASSSAATDWARVRPVLDEAMRELAEPDREAVLLRYFEQRPFAAIGAALDITEDAARMRVERALDKLHALLTRRGVTSTGAALTAVLANQAMVAAPAGLVASVTTAALGGAATTAGVMGFLKFMSTAKFITTTAGVIALIAIGTTVYQARVVDASATALHAIRDERDKLHASLARTEAHARQADDDLAAARKELDDLRANSAKPAPVTAARTAASLSGSSVDYVLDHPESRAAYIEGEVLRARAHFERFFKQAALSPAQQEQFLKNLKDYAEARLDFMGAARAQGYQANTSPQNLDREVAQQLGRMEKQAPIDLYANMRLLLGDDAYNQYQQYTRTLPARNVVDVVASRLYDSESPLTAAQASQLTEIIAQNPFRDLNQTTPFRGNTMAGAFVPGQAYGGARTQMNLSGGSTLTDWHEPVTDAAIARAAAVLTPTQIAALRLVQEEQMAQLLAAPPTRSPDVPKTGKPMPGK